MRAVHEEFDDRQVAGEVRLRYEKRRPNQLYPNPDNLKPLNREGAKVARKTRITNFLF
jgi:hypothetical protein